MADLFEPDETLLSAFDYRGFWQKSENSPKLTAEENATLVSMKFKSLPQMDTKETIKIYSGLIEILFGYCYAQRIFQDELEPEASWTIQKISPMLSWVSLYFSAFKHTFK